MFFESYLPVLIAFFIVTVSPGPANVAVATVAMSKGRHSGLTFGLGLALGLAFWGLIAATGLGVVLQASEWALFALKVFGRCYLLWLAFHSARSAIKSSEESKGTTDEGWWFYRGLLLNLSNPKAVVAWMAALSMGLGSGNSVAQLALVTALCMLLGLANYMGYAIAFSFSPVMSGYRRLRRWIEGIVAGLFAMAGFGLIKTALAR